MSNKHNKKSGREALLRIHKQLADAIEPVCDAVNTKRVNMYRCDTCGQAIFTVDRAVGVTPMFLSCRASEDCNGRMQSAFYPKDNWFPLTPVKWEWYKPGKKEMKKLSPGMRDHVKRGGLVLRMMEKAIAFQDLPDFEGG